MESTTRLVSPRFRSETICEVSVDLHPKLSVEAHFDFEGFGAQSVLLRDAQTPDCANAPDDYCKGDLFATLFQK